VGGRVVLSDRRIRIDSVAAALKADDVNLLGDNIDTIKKNTEALIDTSKEVGLEVNTEKSKYMLLSHHQNSGQNHDIKNLPFNSLKFHFQFP
jgi:hypothetical protein